MISSAWPTPLALLADVIFGAIGFGAFVYGRKTRTYQPMVLGVALMGYPYLVSNTFLLYAIGVGLCVALALWRD